MNRPRRFHKMLRCAVGLMLVMPAADCCADLIKLIGGGEIRGKITSKFTKKGQEPIEVTTLTGAQIVVDRDNVQFVTKRSLQLEEYETRAKAIPDTVQAHWELAAYCDEHGLKQEREDQLQQVLELDPDHEEAHLALKHIRHEGEWTTRAELMEQQGYVKYRGRYISTQEMELIAKSRDERAAEQKWFKKIRLWKAWLEGSNRQRQITALNNFQEIEDPHAIPALERFFSDNEHEQARELYVGILAKIAGSKPVKPLVNQALYDLSQGIRRLATDAIANDQLTAAVPYYLRALKDDDNLVVRRAAAALGAIGDTRAIAALIKALNTIHKYRVQTTDESNNISFSTDGSFALGGRIRTLPPQIEAMLRSGQLPYGVVILDPKKPEQRRWVTIRHEHQNVEARQALIALTGQDFGFNERDWTLWWSSRQWTPGPTIPQP